MRHVVGRFRSFFCTATDPLNLAAFRVVLFAFVLWLINRLDFLAVVHMPATLRVPPAGYESFFHRIPMEDAWVIGAQRVALLACAAALVGFMTRTSAAVACVCGTYLLGLPEIFGKINHTSHHLIWFTAILAAAPSGDALSIDALRAAWQRADRGDTSPPRPAVAYSLPLRFVWLLIGVLYLFPGLWKLHAGPEWFLGDNIKYTMYDFWSRKGFLPALRIDRYPWLYRGSGLATIIFETSFLFCLFFPRLRLLAVAGGVLFHWMTKVYLRIFFTSLLVCYAAFVNWSWLCEGIGRMFGAHALSLVYDGRSRVSRRLIASLRSLDVFHLVRCIDAFADDARAGDTHSFDGIVATARGHAMTGLRAWWAVATRVPLIAPAAPLLLGMILGIRGRQRRIAVLATDVTPHVTRPRLAGVVVVGSLLLAANTYCGIRGTISWPFSVYPQFASIHSSPTRTALEAVIRSPQRQARPVEIDLRPETLRRVLREDPAVRAQRLRGIRDLLFTDPSVLQPGAVLELYEMTWSTLPEDRHRPPLRRELLDEFRVDTAKKTAPPS
jgi:HTTM domain